MNTHTQTVKIHQCQAASVPSPSLRYYSASFKKGKRKAAKRKQKKIQRAARGESNGKQPKREDAFLFLPPTPLTFTQDALIASVRPPFLHSSWLIHPPALAFELGPFKKSADSVFLLLLSWHLPQGAEFSAPFLCLFVLFGDLFSLFLIWEGSRWFGCCS